LDLLV
jgi:hypothetical protein